MYLKYVLRVWGVIVYDPNMSSSIEDHQLIVVLQTEGRKSRIHPKYPFQWLNGEQIFSIVSVRFQMETTYPKTYVVSEVNIFLETLLTARAEA